MRSFAAAFEDAWCVGMVVEFDCDAYTAIELSLHSCLWNSRKMSGPNAYMVASLLEKVESGLYYCFRYIY